MVWAYSDRQRDTACDPPAEYAAAFRWLTQNTVGISDLSPDTEGTIHARAVLDRVARKQNGQPAATTVARKRMTFNNALEYACERGVIPSNPMGKVKYTRQRAVTAIDLAIVLNAEQAGRFLAAVKELGEPSVRLVAFFALIYYAAIRPEEAAGLMVHDLVSLPEAGWGEARLDGSEPRDGRRWTNSRKAKDRRPLKAPGGRGVPAGAATPGPGEDSPLAP